jgi:nitrate reductase assembly molybdenum cofactor insertion protein NarJ
MEKYRHYAILADMFRYPEENFLLVLDNCMELLHIDYPEAATELQPFFDYTKSRTIIEWEELYTKTFDVQPICYLDLGYVMFGEDYKRGAFLVQMQVEQRKANNDCGADLADNLCNALTLLHKTDEQDFIDELAVKILKPAVKKMIQEFSQARVELKNQALKKLHKAIIQEELNVGNVYQNMFSALLNVLEKDFTHKYEAVPENITANIQHHQCFFAKSCFGGAAPKEMTNNAELNTLINNYKMD